MPVATNAQALILAPPSAQVINQMTLTASPANQIGHELADAKRVFSQENASPGEYFDSAQVNQIASQMEAVAQEVGAQAGDIAAKAAKDASTRGLLGAAVIVGAILILTR